MTGWRCGWMVGPKPVIQAANALQSHATSNVNSITQKAAVAALTGPQQCVDGHAGGVPAAARPGARVAGGGAAPAVRRAAGRVLPVSGRQRLPVARRASARRSTSPTRCSSDEHVVTTAGEAFDAPGYIRLSYATSLDRLREGVTRLIRFVRDGAVSTVPARWDRSVTPDCRPRLHEAGSVENSLDPLVQSSAPSSSGPTMPRGRVRHRRAEARPSAGRRRAARQHRGGRGDRAAAATRRARRSCRAAAAPATPAAPCPSAAASCSASSG